MYIPTEKYSEILKIMPIVCVDLIIVHEGKFLLLLRDNEPAKNQYWFPGGRINKMESIKDATIRKAIEETNLVCTFSRIISVEETIFEKNSHMQTDIHTINICCLLELSTTLNEVQLDNLHIEYKWFSNIDISFHEGVANPLRKIGFELK